MGTRLVKGLNPLLQYVADLMSLFQVKPITEPAKYRDKVLAVKEVLKHDVSGLVNTTIDYGIAAASSVQYKVVTDDPSLTETLNTWLENINEELRGHIPTGVSPLAKEYCRERWKGSSQLLLRTFWETIDGLQLPTKMFFVDGEDVVCKNAEDPTITLGEEKYALRISNDEKDDIPLPKGKDEEIFLQMPYEAWGARETTPYLMLRGIWHNVLFMKMLSEKGEFVVARALEYLFLIKKGTENLYLNGNISYSKEDLEKVSKDFQTLLATKQYDAPLNTSGTPTYATQFDTSMEHLIPDYNKIISQELFSVMERRILAGLGLIQSLEGATSSSKKDTYNARPFVAEIRQTVHDFSGLLTDIMKEIASRNKKKWKNASIHITVSPITDFISDEGKNLLRSLYDRGVLSRQTLIDIVGDLDFDTEVTRLKDEKKKKLDETMFPPVIQNLGPDATGGPDSPMKVKEPGKNPNPDKVPADKKGPEKRNYKKASMEDGEMFSDHPPFEKPNLKAQPGSKEPPLPGPNFTRDETTIVNLPADSLLGQMKCTNCQHEFNSLSSTKSGQGVVKCPSCNKDTGYVELPEQHGLATASMDELIELKKLGIMSKQEKVLNKLLKESNDETV